MTSHKQSSLERLFIAIWERDAPEGLTLIPEYIFHPVRDWRFDFADPVHKVAVECEGAVWTGGRHTRGAGFIEDCWKYNHAVSLGWKLFRFTRDMLENDPAACIEMVVRAIEGTHDDT